MKVGYWCSSLIFHWPSTELTCTGHIEQTLLMPLQNQKNEDDDSASMATQVSISKRWPLLCIDYPSSTIYLWHRNNAVIDTGIKSFPSHPCSMSVLLLRVKVLLIWFICKTVSSHPTPFNNSVQVCWENWVSHPYSLLHIYFDLRLNLDMQILSMQVN